MTTQHHNNSNSWILMKSWSLSVTIQHICMTTFRLHAFKSADVNLHTGRGRRAVWLWAPLPPPSPHNQTGRNWCLLRARTHAKAWSRSGWGVKKKPDFVPQIVNVTTRCSCRVKQMVTGFADKFDSSENVFVLWLVCWLDFVSQMFWRFEICTFEHVCWFRCGLVATWAISSCVA